MDEKLQYIYSLYPHAQCELHYQTIFQLLIAVVLSAQTTDARVNQATEKLFLKFPDAHLLKNASLKEVEEIIKSIGMYKVKAKHLLEIAKIIDEKYHGEVPKNKEDLLQLPGVGNKTANVILAEGYKIPALPVDTHIHRIAKRLKYADIEDSVEVVEEKLKKAIEPENWIQMHHSLIFSGRYFCKAKQPECDKCQLKDQCQKEYKPLK